MRVRAKRRKQSRTLATRKLFRANTCGGGSSVQLGAGVTGGLGPRLPIGWRRVKVMMRVSLLVRVRG